MTMRVSLIIDGDPKGAKAAVNATEAELSRLGKTAADTQAKLNNVKPPIKPVEDFRQQVKLSAQDMANMQFQLQDMAVGLASGQSPFTVMMQQGSQMTQMFKSGTGVMGALKAVGGGVAQFLTNPLNLAVLGFGVAASAATTLFSVIANDNGNDVLENHADLIKRIGDEWDDSAKKFKKYSTESREGFLLDALISRPKLQSEFDSSISAFKSQVVAPGSGGKAMTDALGGVPLSEIRAAGSDLMNKLVDDFRASIQRGSADVEAFKKEMQQLGIDTPSDKVRQLANRIADSALEADKAQQALRQNRDVTEALRGNVNGLTGALGRGADAVGNLNRKLGEMTNGAAFAASHGFARSPRTEPSRQDQFFGRALLDLIAEAEGTAKGRGYNETLGYGAFTGGPVDLVTMKLSEVLELQKRMLAHPDNSFNSSAAGRYQITRQNILEFMPKLGLDGDTIFGPDIQDKIALALASRTGGDPRKLDSTWVGLQQVSDIIKGQAFSGSMGERSGVANAIAGVDRKSKITDLTEEETVKKRLEAQETRWGEIIANSTARENARSEAVGKSAREQARLRVETELWQQANGLFGDRLAEDKKLHDEVTAAIRRQADAAGHAAAQQDLLTRTREASAESERQQIARLDEVRGTFGGMASTFARAKQENQSWGDSFNTVLEQVANKGLSLLDKVLDGLVDGLLFGKQGTSGGGFLGGFLASLLPAAKGAAFAGGLTAFAAGASFANTIVASPTLFQYGAGKLGVMGEAGPEAIVPLKGGNRVGAVGKGGETGLPLARLSDGSLGVDLRGASQMAKAYARGDSFGATSGAGTGRMADGFTVNLNTHNYGTEPVEAKATQNGQGGFDIEVVVGKAMNKHLAEGGADRVLGGRFNIAKRVDKNG